jgi:hypothetical protein
MIITIVLNDRGNPPSLEVHLALMCDEELARDKNILIELRALVPKEGTQAD